MDRRVVLDALAGCVTRDEAEAALDQADAWVKAHPDDLDVRHVMESAVLVVTAWDLPLDRWPQSDRDALLRETGHSD
jgi:hypothetical protein